MKRLYGCLKLLNLSCSCIYLSPSKKIRRARLSARLSILSCAFSLPLSSRATFAISLKLYPRRGSWLVLRVTELRFRWQLNRSSCERGPLLYSIPATLSSGTAKRGNPLSRYANIADSNNYIQRPKCSACCKNEKLCSAVIIETIIRRWNLITWQTHCIPKNMKVAIFSWQQWPLKIVSLNFSLSWLREKYRVHESSISIITDLIKSRNTVPRNITLVIK